MARPIRTLGDVVAYFGLQCKKKNGNLIPFDVDRITKDLMACFTAHPLSWVITPLLVEELVWGVVNTIVSLKVDCPTTKEVKQYVVQQLWAKAMHDQADWFLNR